MKSFLEAIDKKQCLEYGKGFTLNLDEQYFNDNDMKLINLLLEIYELNNIIEANSYSSVNFKMLKGKKAYLTDMHVKRFFTIFKGKTINTINEFGTIKNIKVEDEMF
ncbi:MAG TPA: hypothetical protein DCL31_08545, partial [Clostridium sp.]|nr:hypothetical protein [Clostridium sp.]